MKKLIAIFLCSFAMSTWAYDYTPIHAANLPFDSSASGYIDNDNYLYDIMMSIADHSSIYDVGPADDATYYGPYVHKYDVNLPFENGSELTTNDRFLYDQIIENRGAMSTFATMPDHAETAGVSAVLGPIQIGVDRVWRRDVYLVMKAYLWPASGKYPSYEAAEHGTRDYIYMKIGEGIVDCTRIKNLLVRPTCDEKYPLGLDARGQPIPNP